ncbi:hypothetical protein MASR1M90_14530 [Desulfovibrionales bacterium]
MSLDRFLHEFNFDPLAQYPQYPQKGWAGPEKGGFEDIGDIEHRVKNEKARGSFEDNEDIERRVKSENSGQGLDRIPDHVVAALEAAGVILPDELPAWTPEHCQAFLLMVRGVSHEFRLRGPLGFHGIDCPDRWGVEFNAALQSIYVRAMQCDEKVWRDFLDRFDGVK